MKENEKIEDINEEKKEELIQEPETAENADDGASEEDEIEERVSRACRIAAGRAHVSPESVVRCPRCGFEFKVGKSLR